jgi:hypothetical protein
MLINCKVCNTEARVSKGRKYCSRRCCALDQRGRSLPHTPEWEAKRLAAVRIASARRRGVKTGLRPPGVIEKMRDGCENWRRQNPEAAAAVAIRNLPKDVAMENNPNWRGGRTKNARDFYTRNSGKIVKWRAEVFERDGHRCKGCGATERLECHHILPLVTTKAFAFHRANGVTLCHSCHKKTDSWATKGRDHSSKDAAAGSIHVRFIPQSWHDYDTCGNWQVGEDGSVLILVSQMSDPRYQQLVAVHELVECLACIADGVTQEMVDAFDMGPGSDLDEPGNSPEAPYHHQHMMATEVEKRLAAALHVNWDDYDAAVGDAGIWESDDGGRGDPGET